MVTNELLKPTLSEQYQELFIPQQQGRRHVEIVHREKPYLLCCDVELNTTSPLMLKTYINLTDQNIDLFPDHVPEFDIILERNVLAARRLHFELIGNDIEITSASATRRGFEGNGFSTLLFSITDQLIPLLINTYPQLFVGKQKIYAVIEDFAYGRDKSISRQGWSSSIAERSGYQRISSPYGEISRCIKHFR